MRTSVGKSGLAETSRRAPGGPGGGAPTDAEIIARLQRQVFDLHTVFEIARLLQAIQDPKNLIEGVLLTIIGHLEVGSATLTLVNPPHTVDINLVHMKGWENYNEADWLVRADSPFVRRMHSHGLPILIDTALAWPHAESDTASRFHRRGCQVIAPLATRDSLLGLLFLPRRIDNRAFSGLDLQFLSLLTEQITVALENAFLHESDRCQAIELLETREQLARAEKSAALGNLASTVAHEVSNPLGIIKNHIHVLRPLIASSGEGVEKLDLIGREVDRLSRFVRGLFSTFHHSHPAPMPVDVADILRELVEFVEPELNACDIDIALNAPLHLPQVWANQESARQVFLNLILNARDAMPGGGTLTVSALPHGDSLRIDFTDEGAGIDPSIADRLFQPFVTTRRDTGGTGLGLAISRNLVEAIGGRIEATSTPQGATFTVILKCTPVGGTRPRAKT